MTSSPEKIDTKDLIWIIVLICFILTIIFSVTIIPIDVWSFPMLAILALNVVYSEVLMALYLKSETPPASMGITEFALALILVIVFSSCSGLTMIMVDQSREGAAWILGGYIAVAFMIAFNIISRVDKDSQSKN
jgi:hypothetical protein